MALLCLIWLLCVRACNGSHTSHTCSHPSRLVFIFTAHSALSLQFSATNFCFVSHQLLPLCFHPLFLSSTSTFCLFFCASASSVSAQNLFPFDHPCSVHCPTRFGVSSLSLALSLAIRSYIHLVLDDFERRMRLKTVPKSLAPFWS